MSKTPRKTPIAAIKGTKDILPSEVKKWQRVEAAARNLFELYGYGEIRTPLFESTELFEKGTGETSDIVTKEMYTFIDKGGRSITLRPEYTPSVVRAIIEHRLYLEPQPQRFYFIGPMFRYDKPQKGRYRQFHQVDIEVFGEKDPAVDAEIVEMANAVLQRLGVKGIDILVNSVGCRQCRPAYHKRLQAEVENIHGSLCEDCKRKTSVNPLRIFDCKVPGCRTVSESLPKIKDYLCPDCEAHFSSFCSYLDQYGIVFRIEPRLVRGLDYYTKTTFEFVTQALGAQDAILGGGRYDDMMKQFGGPDMCGIGFAMGLERFLAVVPDREEPKDFVYIVHVGEEAKKIGMGLARYLRGYEIECLAEYKTRNMRNQISRASKLKASWAVIIGEDEVREGRFQLKNMETGEQRALTREGIVAAVQKAL